jgi:hypothetical protein
MRWFTRAWQRGDTPESYDPVALYREYLVEIKPVVPQHVFDFAASVRRHLAVDDARLDRFDVDPLGSCARLTVWNGDEPTGYGKLEIDFYDAHVVGATVDEVKARLRHPPTEFLVHEVEVVDGGIEVRFLLYPDGELHIACRDLRVEWRPIDEGLRPPTIRR